VVVIHKRQLEKSATKTLECANAKTITKDRAAKNVPLDIMDTLHASVCIVFIVYNSVEETKFTV